MFRRAVRKRSQVKTEHAKSSRATKDNILSMAQRLFPTTSFLICSCFKFCILLDILASLITEAKGTILIEPLTREFVLG